MCDVFELRHGLDAERERLWDLIDRTPDLTWQLLTKRPENVPRLAPTRWLDTWPAHVWLGTTVEDAVRRDLRVPRLIAVPGVAVRFVSCEPLLGPVSFRWAKWEGIRGHNHLDGLRQLDWVIVGGESGPHHRPMNLDWVRSIRDECDAAGVPFFFKQVGGRTPIAGGDKLDGEIRKAFPRE
jgi:protein gp37